MKVQPPLDEREIDKLRTVKSPKHLAVELTRELSRALPVPILLQCVVLDSLF